jgi:ABC-type glycerol-3-phosphate transport system substrate-binding protein
LTEEHAMQRLVLAAITALTVAAAAGPSSAMPAASLQALRADSSVQQVTFWGRPFPYGYRWSLVRACTRYETVETPRGPRLHRIWVCAGPKRYY